MNEKDDKKVKHYWMMALWLSYISLNSSKYYALVKGFNFFFLVFSFVIRDNIVRNRFGVYGGFLHDAQMNISKSFVLYCF